jgi:arylsulfatase A-like enzyme
VKIGMTAIYSEEVIKGYPTNLNCKYPYTMKQDYLSSVNIACSTVKKYSKALGGLACAAIISSCGNTQSDNQPQSATPPNILFILADDHRWDMLSKFHPIVKTPNLDVLADKGTVFKNAFVTTPICASSRVTILTGLTERTHDFTFGRPKTGIEESANMYPNVVKAEGYSTAFVGKYEIGISGDNNERFDFFKPLLQSINEEYEGKTIPQTYYIAELAKDFIEASKVSGKPWTMSVNFWNPHAHDRDLVDQYHYPEEFESMYADVTIPPAKFSDDATFNALPDFLKESIGRERWHWRYDTPEKYQKMVKRYYRAISAVDKAVGMIYSKLEETGMADNTVIIYMGDNGYNLNERQLAGKWFGWEEDLRIPLIVYDPRNKASHGQEVDKMALNLDIASTIVDLAGVEIPASYQGKSLTPLLSNPDAANWRTEFFFEHMYQPKRTSIPPTVGIRTERWKYVDFFKHDFQQLFDLKNDPEEEINLIDSKDHQDTVATLSNKVDEYIEIYEQQRSTEVKQRESFINVRNP